MASIDKRPNGNYRVRWREYPGGPQKSNEKFKRKVDAQRFAAKIEHDLARGDYIDPAMARTIVEDYYRAWSKRQPWRTSTRATFTSVFENHVLPTFGTRPLGAIRRGDVEAWAAGLPLAGQTARGAVQRLGTMLEAAVADGLLAANPVQHAKRPQVDRAPVVPYTADELERLWEAAPGWFRVAITLGARCGLRQGEATGLSEDRIDFLRRQLVVDRQLVTPPRGAPDFGPPKTKRSYRTVPLADGALDQLAAHLAEYGTGEHGLVLHEDGKPVRRQHFGDIWRPLRDRVGLPADRRYHDTRHTFASTLLAAGVSVPATAEYLGHTPAMLLSTYAHFVPADHDRARSAVQAAFDEAAESRSVSRG